MRALREVDRVARWGEWKIVQLKGTAMSKLLTEEQIGAVIAEEEVIFNQEII